MSETFDPTPAPPLDLRLIEWLERVYPDRAPVPGTPHDRLWWDAGRASVGRTLRMEYERQQQAAREASLTLNT